MTGAGVAAGRRRCSPRRLLTVVGRIEIAVTIASLVAICVLTAATVVARYGFGRSILWAEEVSLLLMKVMVFAGAAAVYKAQAYITVDTFVRVLPESARRALEVAAWVATMIFAVTVCWQGIGVYPTQIAQRSYLLELPKFYFTVPLIYGAGSIVLTSAYYAVCALRRAGGAQETGGIPDLSPWPGRAP